MKEKEISTIERIKCDAEDSTQIISCINSMLNFDLEDAYDYSDMVKLVNELDDLQSSIRKNLTKLKKELF